MFRLRYFNPLNKNTSIFYRNIFRLSSENKPQETLNQAIKQQAEKSQQSANKSEQSNQDSLQKANQEKEVETKYHYNAPQFKQINSDDFLQKMEKLEQKSRFDRRKPVDGLAFPILLCLAAGFLYHCWQTVPYNVVYK